MLDREGIAALYRRARRWAIVGASSDRSRDSNTAVRYMLEQGYEVDPVCSHCTEVEGITVARSIADLDETPDVVVLYRRSEATPAHAQEAVDAGARALWLVEGVSSPEARRIAEGAGLDYVEDTCLFAVHRAMKREGIV